MRALKFLWLMVLMVWVPSICMAEISSQERLMQRPEKDGAIVSQQWLYGEFRYQDYEDGDTDDNFWYISPAFITHLPSVRQLELGSRLYLIHADLELAESEFGLGDIDLWAKYQFLNRNGLKLSGGLLLTLPTGDEAVLHPKASGEVNFEIFCAARYQTNTALALIGHVGFRNNSDAEFDVELKSTGRRVEGEVEGETQFMIGGGLIYQLTNDLNLLGEINIANEAYEDADNDSEITGGIEYSIQPNTTIKAGLGMGIDDGAPDFEVIIGISHSF